MRIMLKENVVENIKRGDFVLLEDGRVALISSDYDDSDYRATVIDGELTKTTDYYHSTESLLNHLGEEYSPVVRAIKSDNIEMREI